MSVIKVLNNDLNRILYSGHRHTFFHHVEIYKWVKGKERSVDIITLRVDDCICHQGQALIFANNQLMLWKLCRSIIPIIVDLLLNLFPSVHKNSSSLPQRSDFFDLLKDSYRFQIWFRLVFLWSLWVVDIRIKIIRYYSLVWSKVCHLLL